MPDKTFRPAYQRRIDETLRDIGAAVAQRRRLDRLTQQTLADKARVSRSTVARIEAGDPGVRVGLVVAVLNALGLRQSLTDAVSPLHDPRATAEALAQLPQRGRF